MLLALLLFAAIFTPIYVHNLQLQSFVANLTRTASNAHGPDEALRSFIVAKANALNLPVTADDVHISRSTDGLHIEVRYFVTVNLPGYTVSLHFDPRAVSR